MTQAQETTHFGHQTVDLSEKATHVREVFDSVASQYDLMNNILSGGIHHLWKQTFAKIVHPHPGSRILDVAGGTGDIALLLRKTCKGSNPPHIICSDINLAMLQEGQKRYAQDPAIITLNCDAESLPFPDQSFDYYTIAFGIRNVSRMELALEEAFRVLKPGGQFACLEFSHIPNPIIGSGYTAYATHVIPRIGKLIAGDEGAYRYLVESIERFPDADQFATKIKSAGFSRVSYRRLSFGIVAIHTGWRI